MGRSKLVIERLDQLEAIASPVRQELLEAVAASTECSVAELASQLGRRPDALYYHIRKLVEVGLIEEMGSRRTAHREESVYRTRGQPVEIRLDRDDPKKIRTVHRLLGALLRLTDRDLKDAIDSGRGVFEGRGRNAGAGRIKGWLTAEDRREVTRLLTRITEIFRRSRDPSRGRLYALTYAFLPLQATASRKSGTQQKEE